MIKTFGEEVYVLTCNAFNTAIVDGKFPASGSFIDVSQYERFAFVIKAGTLTSALTCTVQEATAVNGTPASITGAVQVVGATDDNEMFMIEVETRKLTKTGYRYVTLDVAGAAGGDDFLDIIFLGINPEEKPVTQPATTNTPVIVAG